MRSQPDFLLGVAVGAGLMYLLDPDRGNRRRALIRDQVVHAGHEIEDLGDTAAARARDLGNRARGAAAETRARLRPEEVDNPTLEARVRAELGHNIDSPGAVHVRADNGRVTLTGAVLDSELDDLLSTVRSVRGVDEVDNRLDVRSAPGDTPGLQGTV